MLYKLGEALEISRVEDTNSCVPCVSEDVLDSFRKTALNLKQVAPKAEDFLYFSAVMMHAAESAALNDDGTPKLTLNGNQVKVGWNKDNQSWRWVSNDDNIKPFKNSNGDIFPEEELIKAHKKWIHKPLCIDHKSSSVDHIRGFIVDTYYDRNLKRVIGLCALDKKNYPDLARKVQTGYSSCVSMGTAVGRAICSDCARVARTESDFCDHMKRKTCYGEINVDLNPIELSIVVNGADPKAHIKHIIAAANTLNAYVETKEKELNKIAAKVFKASVSVDDSEGGGQFNGASFNVESSDLETFKTDLDAAISKLMEINESAEHIEEAKESQAFNQSSGSIAMTESEDTANLGLQPPSTPKFASDGSGSGSMEEFKRITSSIEAKLNEMNQNLGKLLTNSINAKEGNMSGSKEINKTGYYLGTEDPTPGQPKYEKEPLNEKLRTDGDKHMEGQMDTGPVDGMHPGPDSVGMSELERKKMLARAEAEERAIRRNAIVNMAKEALEKQSYFQAGDKNPQEPTPGKVKYAPDKLNENLREDEDKQMVGKKPFPGVGSTTEMYPEDKKKKEMLQRASLRAKFVKSADLGSCAWEVFQGDKLLLSASVNDLSGGRSDVLYDSIATKEFGTKLLEKIKTQGAEKIRSLIKKADDMPAPAAPAAPEMAAPEEPAQLPEVSDTGKKGDPKEQVVSISEKLRDLSSDLTEAAKALTGEKTEMGPKDMPEAATEMGATASFSTSTLNNLRRELNGSLTSAMREVIAELNNHQQELEMIGNMYDKGTITESNSELVAPVIEDALNEAKSAVADGFKLMTAFVKYARGTKAIVKRAEVEAQLETMQGDDAMELSVDNMDLDSGEVEDADDMSDIDALLEQDMPVDVDVEEVDDNEVIDPTKPVLNVKPGEIVPPGTLPTTQVQVQASLESKASRAALRAKLAAETLKFSPMLDQAHPKGGTTTQLDVKPQGDLAKVEDLEEVSKSMNDLANAPPKVRKEAEAIHQLVSEGKLDPADLDALVAEGLDPAAKAYYQKYYSQVDGGSEFAKELVKEHVKAQMEAELNKYRVKLARAYELTYDMVERGLCTQDRDSISTQVDEIMKFNDDSFDSLKKVVGRHNPIMQKKAGRLPQVGVIGSGEVSNDSDDMVSQLEAALSKTTKKLF